MANKDTWNVNQYERFKQEREQPFWDLADLVRPMVFDKMVDLGCGTGELTRGLHEKLQVRTSLGVDSSAAMLAAATRQTIAGLSFREMDIAQFCAQSPERSYDLVFSNAALQWLDRHAELFPKVFKLVRPGGQLAIQMPANQDHISHTLAAVIAQEEPYRSQLAGWVRESSVQAPQCYAALLYAHGFRHIQVLLKVYLHELSSPLDILEWVKGTLLTAYEKRLPAETFASFKEEYARRLLEGLGAQATGPHLYTFKRVLMTGQLIV